MPGESGHLYHRRGGFQFNIQELGQFACSMGSARFVSFSMTKPGDCCATTRRTERGRLHCLVTCAIPDFRSLAEAYGARGERVTSLPELVQALERALEAETITVIDVKTPDGFANFG